LPEQKVTRLIIFLDYRLERFYELTVGRELKMIELKEKLLAFGICHLCF